MKSAVSLHKLLFFFQNLSPSLYGPYPVSFLQPIEILISFFSQSLYLIPLPNRLTYPFLATLGSFISIWFVCNCQLLLPLVSLCFHLKQFHLQISLLHNLHSDCLCHHPEGLHSSHLLPPFLHFVLNLQFPLDSSF